MTTAEVNDKSVTSVLEHLRQPANTRGWKVEAKVRTIAGALIMFSLVLALHDKRWLLLSAFVGINLFQSGISGWCLLSNLLAQKPSNSRS